MHFYRGSGNLPSKFLCGFFWRAGLRAGRSGGQSVAGTKAGPPSGLPLGGVVGDGDFANEGEVVALDLGERHIEIGFQDRFDAVGIPDTAGTRMRAGGIVDVSRGGVGEKSLEGGAIAAVFGFPEEAGEGPVLGIKGFN